MHSPAKDGPVGTGLVLMAVYRPDPVLLERQVNSLRAQTFDDWQCFIGLDGRDPEALMMLRGLTDGDPRFVISEYGTNLGVYRHFERLLGRVPPEASWVALADQDDYWYPHKIARLLSALFQPGVSAVTGQAKLVDREGTCLGFTHRRPGNLVQTLIRNQVTGSLTLVRREVVTASLPFPRATDIAIHDHWLGVCAAMLGHVQLIDEPVQDYVQHDRNVLGEAVPLGTGQTWRLMRSRGGARPYLSYVSKHHWGWRVSMAETLLTRDIPDRRVRRRVAAAFRGRIGIVTVLLVSESVLLRRLPLKAAIGMLAAAAYWPRVHRREVT